MGNLRVEEPVHTSWSRFCNVNHPASESAIYFPTLSAQAEIRTGNLRG